MTDGIVKDYIFTIYENENDNFDEKKLTKMKFIMPAIEKVSPNDVEEGHIISRANKFLKNSLFDNKFQMKVAHGDKQEVTLDIEDLLNPKGFYLRINEEIDTVNDNPTYESMVKVSEKYIKSNFRYYVDKDDKSILE